MMSGGAKKGQKNGGCYRGGLRAVTGLFSGDEGGISTKHQYILYIWYIHYFPQASVCVCVCVA